MPRKTPDIIANLTPASGRQDHTTSPSASASFVRALTAPDAIASTASRPAYRDDREPPLQGDETVRDKEVICREAEAEHSSRLDTNLLICPAGYFVASRPVNSSLQGHANHRTGNAQGVKPQAQSRWSTSTLGLADANQTSHGVRKVPKGHTPRQEQEARERSALPTQNGTAYDSAMCVRYLGRETCNLISKP
jgi:hypothetical protein